MKKNHFYAWPKLRTTFLMGVGALLLASCAVDGFDDETYKSDVYNTELLSPAEEDIKTDATTDGSRWIISWPVVNGAKGYDCKVYDVTTGEDIVLVDSIVDGTSFTVKREEDSNYKFVIRTIADETKGNTGSSSATTKEFTSFQESYAIIPTNQDLYEYFNENGIPEQEEPVVYDLEANGSYTYSQTYDFGNKSIVLRCRYENSKPTVTMGDAAITTCAPLTLKNIKFDCTAISGAVVALSKDEEQYTPLKGKTGSGDYYNIMGGTIYFANCEFENVPNKLIFDNDIKYCAETVLIDNCKIHFVIPSKISDHAYIYFKSGFIKDLTIKNSTLWNTGEGDLQYFVRYNNSGRLDRAGYDKNTTTQSVNHINSTFYNLAHGWWANYNGFAGQKYTSFDIERNIFVECGKGGSGIARRLLGGRNATSYGKCVFGYNTYWTNGAAEKEGAPNSVEGATSTYDTSGNALQSDPALVNPAGGDLTPIGSEQVELHTGDPRWW